jgi:hypothetical protein
VHSFPTSPPPPYQSAAIAEGNVKAINHLLWDLALRFQIFPVVETLLRGIAAVRQHILCFIIIIIFLICVLRHRCSNTRICISTTHKHQ